MQRRRLPAFGRLPHTLVATLAATFVMLLAGGATSIVLRRLWPPVLSIALAVALSTLVDAALDSPGIVNVVLLALAAVVEP